MKNNIYAIIFGLAIIIAAALLGNAFQNRNTKDGIISVTGLGKADFTSDLIVWEGSYSTLNANLQQAYTSLENDKKIITQYLNDKGVDATDIVFNAVTTSEKREQNYSDTGRYLGDKFIGYQLSQSIKIESTNVAQIEKISREITELLNKGVQFYSQPPRYYYTKLADLKIEMISKATEDARVRAEKIAENSRSELGDLIDAKMGIFQITGQNSNENYSWGGTFNTSAKKKTASITMKLNYKVK
ncbi:MAG: SIMPL domain-containing protein [Flavobacteriaceae bacterium]|nr:SIMPL domain-containing protein [Flavobacteriaceae bacterium]